MKRNPHTPDEKAKLVLEALSGERTINEIASEHEIICLTFCIVK